MTTAYKMEDPSTQRRAELLHAKLNSVEAIEQSGTQAVDSWWLSVIPALFRPSRNSTTDNKQDLDRVRRRQQLYDDEK